MSKFLTVLFYVLVSALIVLNLTAVVTGVHKIVTEGVNVLDAFLVAVNLGAGAYMLYAAYDMTTLVFSGGSYISKKEEALMRLMPLRLLIEQAGYKEIPMGVSAKDMWLYHHEFKPPKTYKWYQLRKKRRQALCNKEISRRGKKESEEYIEQLSKAATIQANSIKQAHMASLGGIRVVAAGSTQGAKK